MANMHCNKKDVTVHFSSEERRYMGWIVEGLADVLLGILNGLMRWTVNMMADFN